MTEKAASCRCGFISIESGRYFSGSTASGIEGVEFHPRDVKRIGVLECQQPSGTVSPRSCGYCEQ